MFDMTQRRMISAGSNGTVKVWNFSNGSSLKNLCMTDAKDRKTPVVDKEVTALLAVYN
jgi:WD40 repeat protein